MAMVRCFIKSIWSGIEVGTFASASGGRYSEQQGVAAVEIFHDSD